MSIIRGPRPEANYYTLDKRISEDARLGWAARGLLIYLLGKPDNWKVSVENLRKQTAGARIRTGRDGVYALLRELEAAGYVRLKQKRSSDGRGFGESDYQVSESVLPAQPVTREVETRDVYTPETTLTSTEEATRIEKETKTESTNTAQEVGALARTIDFKSLDVPSEFGLDPKTVKDFITHRLEIERIKGLPLTTMGWQEVVQKLKVLWEQGADVNEALKVAMAMGYGMPVDPSRGKDAKIARRQRALQQDTDRSVDWALRNQPSSSPDREGAWNAH